MAFEKQMEEWARRRETRPLLIKMLELGRRRRIGALGPRYKYGIMP
jgi:hypothetical protein